MSPHVTAWEKWQGVAIREANRGRVKDPRIIRRLSWVSVSTQFPEDRGNPGGSFWELADRLGGRDAEAFWIRLLQWVGLNDPRSGRVVNVARDTFYQVLDRGYDRVTPKVGIKVWDALFRSRLLSKSCDKPCCKPCSKVATNLVATEVDLEVEVDSDSEVSLESNTAVDSVQAAAVTTLEPRAKAEAPGACACADGLLRDGSYCRTCPAGTRRRALWKELRDHERSTEAKARKARKERGRFRPAPGSLEEGAA